MPADAPSNPSTPAAAAPPAAAPAAPAPHPQPPRVTTSTAVTTSAGSVAPSASAPATSANLPAVRAAPAPAVTNTPATQLGDLPIDELEHLAEEFGLDPKAYKTRQHLIAAVHERRQLIAAMDRDAMLDVIRWGRRPVPVNAPREQLALEIARIRSMKFDGLSPRGLFVLAQMRGVRVTGKESIDAVVRLLHKNEGLFARLARKRRAWVGRMVAGMLGDAEAESEYQFLPPPTGVPGGGAAGGTGAGAGPQVPGGNIADEIEEQGLFGGLASRVKRTADSYLNQKLDEIEQRIDRKLDEIDRRLAEWRDKEIANRIRIIKITLWASVAVAALSLLYSYVVELVRYVRG